MNATKAETLSRVKEKLTIFRVPQFFYFKVGDLKKNKTNVLSQVKSMFSSFLAVRSSSIYEDGVMASLAGKFDSVLNINSRNELDVIQAKNTVVKNNVAHPFLCRR